MFNDRFMAGREYLLNQRLIPGILLCLFEYFDSIPFGGGDPGSAGADFHTVSVITNQFSLCSIFHHKNTNLNFLCLMFWFKNTSSSIA